MIYYQLNETTFNLGDTVTGTCQWQPSENEAKRTAKLTVGWRTEGRGDVDREVFYETELLPLEITRFSCKIPLNAHPSYDGQLLRIIWEVSVSFSPVGLLSRLGITKQPLEAKSFRVVAENR